MIHSHRNLDVWQMSMTLTSAVYALTRGFPDAEKFGLTSQMRRAAVSVPSNIAEGAARGSDADFLRFLFIARGSLAELETQLILARELGLTEDVDDTERAIADVSGCLNGLINHLKNRQRASRNPSTKEETP